MLTNISLTANQRSIVLWFTFILVVLVLGAAILYTVVQSTGLPKPPALTLQTGETPEIKAKEIQNYKALIEALQVSRSSIYETVVIKTLLTLFNTIIATVLTYVFTNAVSNTLQTYFINKNKNQ